DARRADAAVELFAILVFAVIPGGGHDDDAGVEGAARGQTDRVVLITVFSRSAKAQIDDADVVGCLVGNAPVNRRDDGAGVAVPVLVQCPQPDQPHAWRDAGVIAVREAGAPGDERGDVRAVPMLVERSGGITR